VRLYEGRRLANRDEEVFDQGLAFDLETLIDRRRMLKLMGRDSVIVGHPRLGGSGSCAGSSAAILRRA
jgi:hypothetical protein